MDDFAQEIAEAAKDAVAVCEHLRGEPLDYSEASLALVAETLVEAADWDDELTPEQFRNFARSFGCYILEVARPEHFDARLATYREAPLSDDERFSLMEMLVQCINDMVPLRGPPEEVEELPQWQAVVTLLRERPQLHASTIAYRSVFGRDDPEEQFRVSVPMRRVWAAERVNGRLKVFWGLDDGTVVGAPRFHAHVGAVLVVHLAFATQLARQQRNEGSFGKMKL